MCVRWTPKWTKEVNWEQIYGLATFTPPFNNMRTLKSKAQPTNAFFVTVNQMFGGSSQLPTLFSELCSTIWFDYRALGSSRKLGGSAEHLIAGNEKRSCRRLSPHAIERRSKTLSKQMLISVIVRGAKKFGILLCCLPMRFLMFSLLFLMLRIVFNLFSIMFAKASPLFCCVCIRLMI